MSAPTTTTTKPTAPPRVGGGGGGGSPNTRTTNTTSTQQGGGGGGGAEEPEEGEEEEIEKTNEEKTIELLTQIEKNQRPGNYNPWVVVLVALSSVVSFLIALSLQAAVTKSLELLGSENKKVAVAWGWAIAILVVGVIILFGLSIGTAKAAEDKTFEKLAEKI